MPGILVNDVHSQLNRTHVRDIARPKDVDALRRILAEARDRRVGVSLCGSRHAGGGQQFRTDQQS